MQLFIHALNSWMSNNMLFFHMEMITFPPFVGLAALC